MCFTRPRDLRKLITVGPKSVLTLYCMSPKCIVFNICSHISVQGKWLVLSCPLFGGFTGLEGKWMSNFLFIYLFIFFGGGGRGAGAPSAPPPPSSYAPVNVSSCKLHGLIGQLLCFALRMSQFLTVVALVCVD